MLRRRKACRSEIRRRAQDIGSPVPTNSGLLGKFGSVGRCRRRCRSHRRLPIFHQQIAARGVRIDWPVYVTSTVEVVGKTKSESRSEISFETQLICCE